MATDASFVEYVLEQARLVSAQVAEGGSTRASAQAAAGGSTQASAIDVKKMFGEYALYCEQKVVALICDNQVFLKNLPIVQAVLPNAKLGLPYPGAKPHLILDPYLDDAALVGKVIRLVANELPQPKVKVKADKPKKAATKKGKKPTKAKL